MVMPTIGARRHAEKVAEWGVDAVIAQGGEGGGHTGTVPTSLLLRRWWTRSATRWRSIAAGGFFDGRGLVAALAYGADGIAMGTRFLLTQESRVPDAVKQVYLGTPVTGTVVVHRGRRRPPAGHPHRRWSTSSSGRAGCATCPGRWPTPAPSGRRPTPRCSPC